MEIISHLIIQNLPANKILTRYTRENGENVIYMNKGIAVVYKHGEEPREVEMKEEERLEASRIWTRNEAIIAYAIESQEAYERELEEERNLY